MTDDLIERDAQNWRRGGEAQVAHELREIAKDIECGQRQMHLEIAAQIVEQGQFSHPDTFGMEIEFEALTKERDAKCADELTRTKAKLEVAREALKEVDAAFSCAPGVGVFRSNGQCSGYVLTQSPRDSVRAALKEIDE